MSTICPEKIRAALHVDADKVTNIVHEMIEKSNRWAIGRIPDGGTIDPHDNHETIIYGTAEQAYKEYNEVNNAEGDLVDGQMEGVNCTGLTTSFDTKVNPIKDNACAGECIIEFGQGFRRRGFVDRDIKPKTPVICAQELANKGRAHVLGFFNGFVQNFTEWGFNNYDANLLNLVIRNGEANATVLGPDYFDVTTGRFYAPPENRISIWFLKRYRMHMVREKGIGQDENLEIEMPSQDFIDAIRYHQAQINPGISITTELFKDEEGALRGREFMVYDGIKCYFNETPVKGYFKQNGQTVGGQKLYTFVRVYPWTNEAGEEAGLVTRPNHAYDRSTIVCEGATYNMCILAFVINPRSFTRYGINPIVKPGEPAVNNNFNVVLRDGPWLAGVGCGNDYNDKFRLVARHQFRLRMVYPEWSGAIAYRASDPQGYVVPVCNWKPATETEAPASAQTFDKCGPTACMQATCEECGKVADENGQCVDAEDLDDAVVQLNPCGSADTAYTGTTHRLRVRVSRVGTAVGAASVQYTTTDVAGAGLATTPEHYQDMSAVPGTVSWADGDNSDKFIELDIKGASGDPETPLTFTIHLQTPTGVTIHGQCDDLVVSIWDETP